jgi:hypothetical protein
MGAYSNGGGFHQLEINCRDRTSRRDDNYSCIPGVFHARIAGRCHSNAGSNQISSRRNLVQPKPARGIGFTDPDEDFIRTVCRRNRNASSSGRTAIAFANLTRNKAGLKANGVSRLNQKKRNQTDSLNREW